MKTRSVKCVVGGLVFITQHTGIGRTDDAAVP